MTEMGFYFEMLTYLYYAKRCMIRTHSRTWILKVSSDLGKRCLSMMDISGSISLSILCKHTCIKNLVGISRFSPNIRFLDAQ